MYVESDSVVDYNLLIKRPPPWTAYGHWDLGEDGGPQGSCISFLSCPFPLRALSVIEPWQRDPSQLLQLLGSSVQGTSYLKLFSAWLQGGPRQMWRCKTVGPLLGKGRKGDCFSGDVWNRQQDYGREEGGKGKTRSHSPEAQAWDPRDLQKHVPSLSRRQRPDLGDRKA